MARSRFRGAVGLAAALSLVVAACGGDDDDSADDSGDTTPATDAPEDTTPETTEGEMPEDTTPETTAGETPEDTTPDTTPETTAGEPVEEQTIQIGFAWPDLAAFEAVSPAFGVGDQEQQLLSVLEAWRADGTLPVNGIDIEPVFQSFDALDPETKLAACQFFGSEGEVFAVLGARIFTEGAECLATRFQIPVIDTDQAPTPILTGAQPYMFTLKPDTNQSVETFLNWAGGTGALEGANVGLFWESQYTETADLFKELLPNTGATLVSEVESGGQGSVGSEQDALAAQIFQDDGADTVIFLVGSSSITNFTTAAAEQGYTPTYLDLEWSSHMSDVAGVAYNLDQWIGTEALSATTIGDMPDLSETAETCLTNYEAFSGTQIDRQPPEKSGEFSNILLVCDLATILLEGLRGATADGGELTADSFVAAVEAIDGVPGSWIDTISFSADKHTAPGTMRAVIFDGDCTCWRPVGDWMPVSDFLG